jgi:hypothetical protein
VASAAQINPQDLPRTPLPPTVLRLQIVASPNLYFNPLLDIMSTSAPAVAVIGINGFIGKIVMPFAFEALQQKRIKELRILSRKFDENALNGLIAKGATTQNASYNNLASLTQALAGIDIVISTCPF